MHTKQLHHNLTRNRLTTDTHTHVNSKQTIINQARLQRTQFLVRHADQSRGVGVFISVCLSVCLSVLQLSSITLAQKCSTTTMETRLCLEQNVKGQGHESHKHCRLGCLHSCECWLPYTIDTVLTAN